MLNLIGITSNMLIQLGIRRKFRLIIIAPVISSVNEISRG